MFGPGTFVALAAATLISVLTWNGHRPAFPTVGAAFIRPPANFKPEPKWLLANKALKLSPGQRRRIEAIESRWEAKQRQALAAMSAIQPRRGTLDSIQSGLSGYSQLSRRYDAARADFWNLATENLTGAQQAKLHRGNT
ncbi:MAG: hypothetical protein ACYC96_09465 [Fimbriimonadaceae bacterium]